MKKTLFSFLLLSTPLLAQEMPSFERYEEPRARLQEQGNFSNGTLPIDETERKDLMSMNLEELMQIRVPDIVSGGFFKVSAARASGNATVLSQEQIEIAPATRLLDLYDYYVPGVHVGEHPQNFGLLGSRGILTDSNAKTLFLFDGQTINTRMHGYAGSAEWPFFGDMQQIEIVAGPGSLQHGSGAINGFVFLVPKNGKDNPGGFGNFQYGFREKTYRLETGYGLTYGGSSEKNLYLYAGHIDGEGFTPYRYTQTDPPITTLGYGAPSWKTGIYWNHDQLKMNLYYVEVNKQIRRFPWSGRSSSWQGQSSLVFGPSYNFKLNSKNSLELRGAVEYHDIAAHNYVIVDGYDESGYQPPLGNRERHYESKAVLRSEEFTGHSIALGALAGNRKFEAGKTFFSDSKGYSLAVVNGGWNEYGAFAEDIWKVTDDLSVSAGTRYDLVDYGSFDGDAAFRGADPVPVSPESIDRFTHRVAASYNFNQGTIVKTSFQQGFRYPDAFDLDSWMQLNGRFKRIGYGTPLKTLEPETVNSFEVGAQHQFPQLPILIGTNLYYNTHKNILQWADNGPDNVGGQEAYNRYVEVYGQNEALGSTQNNSGKFSALGGEVTTSWNPTSFLKFNGSYGYSAPNDIGDQTDPTYDLTTPNGNSWRRYPRHIFKSGMTSTMLNNKLIFHVTCSHATGVEGKPFWRNPNAKFPDSRTEVNTSVIYQFSSSWSAKFFVKNLLKEKDPKVSFTQNYPEWGSLGDADQLYYGSINYKF